ncbi:hypothetical protein [Taibaiella koreensis]|uniref:hypothetical protein n=1 Tax=Taibaiella koreensis TaxID=1268548 RepID=UPI000E59F3EA|nr:hypothetical protein [Taibaiella koreensis]
MIVRRISYFTFIVAMTTMATVSSCNRAREKAKQSVNYAGAVVGKGSSEFLDGVADGVSQSFDCTLELAKVLQSKGVKGGKFRITTSNNGHENVVSVYLIFDKDYKGPVSARIFDSKDQEYGRATASLDVRAGSAGFTDLVFDERTNIERKSRILLE